MVPQSKLPLHLLQKTVDWTRKKMNTRMTTTKTTPPNLAVNNSTALPQRMSLHCNASRVSLNAIEWSAFFTSLFPSYSRSRHYCPGPWGMRLLHVSLSIGPIHVYTSFVLHNDCALCVLLFL